MIQEVFVGEMLGEYGIPRPVKRIARAELPDKMRHPDMQVSVRAEEGGDGKLGRVERPNACDQGNGYEGSSHHEDCPLYGKKNVPKGI